MPLMTLSSMPSKRAAYARIALLSFAFLSGTAVTVASGEAHAQSFSLPEPTATPTPAPQGPVDVKAGVPIAPRSIPAPSSQQAPPATPEPKPSDAETRPRINPLDITLEPGPQPGDANETPQAQTNAPPPRQIAPDNRVSPPTQPTENSDPVAREEALLLPEAAPLNAPSTGSATPDPQAETSSQDTGYWLWALIALALAALAGGFALIRSRNRPANEPAAKPAAVPVHTPAPEPRPSEEKQPIPVPFEQPRIDWQIDIAGATRSLMMITLDCRITIHNRSERALRNLGVTGALVCAQRSATSPDSVADETALETLERIGPQQSGTITAQLQLPLQEMQPLRQGQKPLCIPLAQISVQTGGNPPRQRSFVIGLPSAASPGRLHPIPLDTPPGSIHGLLSREVKPDAGRSKAA